MSHFSRIKTQMAEKELLKSALTALGYEFEERSARVLGFGGRLAAAEIRVRLPGGSYNIGFVRAGETYDCVADWYGVRGVTRERFVRDVARQYAYQATRAKLEEKGFTLAAEEKLPDGRVHLVLRRMA